MTYFKENVLRGRRVIAPHGADFSDRLIAAARLFPAPIPVIPNIHRAVLAAVSAEGNKLDMDDWHSCDTTHCRAGWVIQLAGQVGAVLEYWLGPERAADLIYVTSDLTLTDLPDYFTNEFTAMCDIFDRAAKEAEQAAAPAAAQ